MIPYYKIKDVLTQDLGKYMQLQISPRNGGFSEERKTIHFPSMTELKIHSINLDTMVSAVRGIARKKLKPGDLLLPADWAGQWTKKVFLYSPKRGFDQGKTKLIKSPLDEKIFDHEATYQQKDHLIEIRFSRSIFIIAGLFYEFQGINEKLLAVHSDELSNGQRSFFQKAMADWPGSKDLYKQSVALRLAIFKELSLPEEKRDIQFSSAKLQDSMLVDKDYWEKSLNGLLKTLKPMGGVDSAVLKQKFGGLLAPLIDAASQRGLIKQWKNYYMINHEEPQKHISPFAASLLEELLHNPQGLSPSKCKDAEQNQYQMMFRMGLIRMSKDMICHEVQYQEACSSLKELLKGQGEHEIDWIKEHCEYSRRQLINYLFWMEEDGEVVNRDNCRSVV